MSASAEPQRGRAGAALVALLLLGLLVAGLSAAFQKPIGQGGGLGWDGVSYYRMAREIAEARPVVAERPFVYRVGLPWLVAQWGLGTDGLRSAFRGWNTLFALACIPALFGLLRVHGAGLAATLLAVAWFVLFPGGPLRFTQFYPVWTDPAAILVTLLVLLRASRHPPVTAGSAALLALLGLAGSLFRESVLLACLASAFAGLPPGGLRALPRRSGTALRLLPAAGALLGIAATHLLVTGTGDYGFASQARLALRLNVYAPERLLVAFLCVYGPLLFPFLALPRGVFSRIVTADPMLCAFAAGGGLLALVGGSDVDRFVFWLHPAILVWAALALPAAWRRLPAGPERRAIAALLAGAALLALRAFGTIPDTRADADAARPWLLGTVYGADAHYLATQAGQMGRRLLLATALEYAGLLALLAWLWRRARARA